MTYSGNNHNFVKVCGNPATFHIPLKEQRNTTADKYLDKYYDEIKRGLGKEKLFSVREVERLLGLKPTSVWQILSRLTREGRVHRISRGRYTISPQPRRNPPVPESSRKIVALLQAEGIQFTLTGLDLLLDFVQHQPETLFHLIYTPRGAGEWAQSTLRSSTLMPLLEPGTHEIENSIASSEREIIIIRERQSPVASQENLATKERAFVDLYFESTRRLIPFPVQEVAYIFENMRSTSTLNQPQLIRYAHERKIDGEIEAILEYPRGRLARRNPRLSLFLKSLKAIR